MAIISLERPVYNQYDPTIAGKVVYTPKDVTYEDYKKTYGFFIYNRYPNVDAAFDFYLKYNCELEVPVGIGVIYGTCTGNWRFFQSVYYVEMELFNPFWVSETGMYSYVTAIALSRENFTAFVTNNHIVFKIADRYSSVLQGLWVSKDMRLRGRTNKGYLEIWDSSTSTYSRGFSEEYLTINPDVKKIDEQFNAPTLLLRTNLSPAFKVSYEGLPEKTTPLLYEGLNGGLEKLGFGPSSTYLLLATGNGFVGGFPYKYTIFAHPTDPNAEIGDEGVIEGRYIDPDGELSWAYQLKGYNYSLQFVYGLTPGQKYYFRTMYECHDYVTSPIDSREVSVDTSTTTIYYSDALEHTMPTTLMPPILYLPGKYGTGPDSITLRVGVEWAGDYPVKEAGVCAIPVSEGRPPTKDDFSAQFTKIENGIMYEELAEDVIIVGLQPSTRYWVRTYVILDDDTVQYPVNHPNYWAVHYGGSRLENVGPEGTPSSISWSQNYPEVPDIRAYVTTKGAIPTLGSIAINQLINKSESSVALMITVDSYGNTSEYAAEVYVTYSEDETIDPSDPKIYLDMSRGYYAPTYVDIPGLNPGTTYYFKAVVKNSVGTAFSQLVDTTGTGVDNVLSFATLDAIDVIRNSMVLPMIVTSTGLGIEEKGICWNIGTATPDIDSSKQFTTGTVGSFYYKLEGLDPLTTVTYRGYVIVDGKPQYGVVKSAKTTSTVSVPTVTVTIYDKKPPTTTTVDVVLSIKSSRLADITESGVVASRNPIDAYVDPSTYTLRDFTPENLSFANDGTLTLGTYTVIGLAAKTFYNVAGYVKFNNGGYLYTPSFEITTLGGEVVPTVDSLPAINIGTKGATFSTRFSSNSPILKCGTIWSTSPISSPTWPPEDIEGVFHEPNTYIVTNYKPGIAVADTTTVDLRGRAVPATTYYYRGYAQNSAGHNYGEQMQFTTLTEDPSATTTITAVPTITANQIVLDATVNSTVALSEYGYIWSDYKEQGSPVNTVVLGVTNLGGGNGVFKVTFNRIEEGNYRVAAYVTTVQGKTFSTPSYNLLISINNDSSKRFNPPIDKNRLDYEFMFDGILRKWFRNSEGFWQLLSRGAYTEGGNSTIRTPAIPGGGGASRSAPEREVVPIQTVATVEEKYLQYTNIGATFPQGATAGFAILYLKDAPKFTYDETLTTELLDISILGVPVRVDSLWIYNPSENSIRSTTYLRPIPRDIREIMDFMNTGGSVAIYPSGKNTYPKELKPSGNALVYGDRILLAGPNKSLDTILTESINYVVTVGCSNYIPEFGEYKYLSPFTDLPPADDMSTYANGYCPISGKISRVVGTFYAEGVKGSGETYPIILEIKSPNIIEYLGDVTVTDGFGKFDLIPLTPITHPGGELTIAVTPADGTTTSTDIKIVATIFLTW